MDTPKLGDLRDWLDVVDDLGQLTVVDGADWDLEIGAISRLNYRRPQPPALLFDNIKGYPPGFRVLTGSVSNALRTGLTLRLGSDLDNAGLVRALSGKPLQWTQDAARFEPEVVSTAPVLENVITGPEFDLNMFPAPRWNELDGGRYIGTGCVVFTIDPDTDLVNGGAYRLQVQDEGRTFTVSVVPSKHGAQNIQKWLQREGRAPVTVSLGQDPLLFMMAGTEVPTGVSELNYAGAVMGRSVEIVKGEVTGLPIPASSEIVVEGWINPERTYSEGPFAEWTGHYTGSHRPVFALDIERIYHRNDPIILGSPAGLPPHDFSYMRTVLKSAMIQDAVVSAGVPGVAGVWAHEAGGGRMLIVVAIDQQYHGHARQAGFIASQSQAGAYMNRFVIVVDDDIDYTDLNDVVWAMCTRCDPAADIDIMRKSWGGRVDPLLVDKTLPYNSRALIDACIPFERKDDFPPLAEASPELLARTAAKWAHILGTDAHVTPGAARRRGGLPETMMDGS